MVKTIRTFYLVNIILFAIMIPLSFFIAYIWSNAAIENMSNQTNDVGEAFAIIFVAIVLIAVAFLAAFVVVVACIVSLVLAIVGYCKIRKAQEPKNMKKLAIVQIIFLGNIVPAILCLKLKPSDFEAKEEKPIEEA